MGKVEREDFDKRTKTRADRVWSRMEKPKVSSGTPEQSPKNQESASSGNTRNEDRKVEKSMPQRGERGHERSDGRDQRRANRDRDRGEQRDRRRDNDRKEDRDQPPEWAEQLESFLRRENLDKRFRETIRAEEESMQRAFVSHGPFVAVRKHGGNASAVAVARLRDLRTGAREPRDPAHFTICEWCGYGVLHEATICGMCKRSQ